MSDEGTTTPPRRSLPLWGFAVVVIVYLAIIQLGGRLAIRVFDVEGDDLLTTRDVLVTMWIPLGTASSSPTRSWPHSAGGGRSCRR